MANLHVASFAQLDAATLYALLRLRGDIFVVEQRSPYPDLDGRDLEPDTRHLWLDAGGDILAYLRLLDDKPVARIGRVCVARHARGGGHAARLVGVALDLVGSRPCTLDAQSYLTGFYSRFGFVPSGDEYVEDGIAHVPMLRPAGPVRAGSPPGPPPAGVAR